MPNDRLVVRIKIAWWFAYLYVPMVCFFSRMTGLMPNEEKLTYWLAKATKVECADT